MRNRIVSSTVILIILFCSSAFSQTDKIHKLSFDTLRTGDVQATPIGVDDMRYVGNTYIRGDDSTVMQYITRVVQRDIDFYADFELVKIDSFYLKTYEITELDLLGWERLGAEYVVKLEAEFPGSNIRVRWKVYYATSRREAAKGSFERKKSQWRVLAHDISNAIVHKLTGDPGIFHTKVAYVRKIGDGKELFFSDYDGANEIQLTNNGSINISPSIHPTRDEVYFTSYVYGDPSLVKINTRTLKLEQIASFKGIVAAPSISPDGNKIACVLSKDGNSEIYVLSIDGRIIKRLTRHRAIDTSPTWSPDGQMIAFSSDRTGRPQLYIMDSDGLNLHRLTRQGYYNDSPIWSARGDRITFVSRTKSGRFDLASIDTTGHDYRILTEVGMNENPHFSPDGKHIIFSSNRLGPREVFTMDITGRRQRRLTRSGSNSNPDWGRLR